jgi:hypothetical protein
MNNDRRRQLREACRLMGEARQIVEMAQQEERDVDAVSFLEQVLDRIEEAEQAIEDAILIGQKGAALRV